MFGTSAAVAYNQGNNILINLFFGLIANAAQAIAFQIKLALDMFASNFFTVIRPSLIKSYAEGNYEYMMRLFYASAKITFCLLLLIFFPLIFNTEYILNLWLDEVNTYMIAFTRLCLIISVVLSMHYPITTVIQATGKVRRYHVIVETFTLLILPITYVLFKSGYSAVWVFYNSIIMFAVAHIVRLFVLRSVISFSMKEYCIKFLMPMSFVTLISMGVLYYTNSLFTSGFFRLIITCIVSVFSVICCAWLFAFSKQEKLQSIKMIKTIINK
jgi:O-antigen/teichoic acid export membrane protein